ncbi:hypothetical protein Tco_0524499 [Tanacetum coccineum]
MDRRAAPIAMAWRHHDSSVADPFPKPDEYNASDVAKLREVVIALRKLPPTFYMLQVFHMSGSMPVMFFCYRIRRGRLLPWPSSYVSPTSKDVRLLSELSCLPTQRGEITVVTLVRDRYLRGKGNLPRLPIISNIVRLATSSTGIQTGAVTPNRSIHNIRVHSQCKQLMVHDIEIMALGAT